jgi:hypothetical protein
MCGSCTQCTPYRHIISFPRVLLLCTVRSFLITRSCYLVTWLSGGRGSSVGIETSLRTGRTGVWIPVGARDYSFLQNVQSRPGAPPSLLFSRYWGILPGVERVKRPRLRMSGAKPSLSHMSSWIGRGTLPIYITDWLTNHLYGAHSFLRSQ